MARSFFLAFFTLIWIQVGGQAPQYELKRGKVLLKPIIPGHPDWILWKHNGNKVVEFNGNEEQVYSPYNDRITLNWVSAELQITDLRAEDSGDYELEVVVGKKWHRSPYKLEVIDKVTKPTISCKMNDSKSSAELECSSEPTQSQSLMEFGWRTRENMNPGQKLKIPLGDESDDEVYSCIVSNPRSNEMATFTAKDCYQEESSSVALTAGLVSAAVLLLVLLVGLGIYCKLYKKVPACFAKRDVENQSPRRPTEGSDNGNVSERLLFRDREITLPSNQHLRQLNRAHDMDKEAQEPLTGRSPACDTDKEDETPKKGHVSSVRQLFGDNSERLTPFKQIKTDERQRSASPRPSLPIKSCPPLDQNNLASNDDGDVDADQHREPTEEEDKQNNSLHSEKSEPEPAAVSDKISEDVHSHVEDSIAPEQPEPEMEAGEDAETSPAAQPHIIAAERSPDTEPEDCSGEHGEHTDSHQVTGGAVGNNVRDSGGGQERRHESDDSREDKLSSNEQRGSKTICDFKTEEADTNKDNQQETVKPGSEDETDKEEDPGDLYSADTSPADPNRGEEEPKTNSDSHESEAQSHKGNSETTEGKNEAQRGLKEEKPGNESVSEEKDG